MDDIAEFLRRHPPFDTLDEETLAASPPSAEIEFHAARAAILESARGPAEHAYVVRRGSVELLVDGRLLDLLGEGEMFGFVSLLDEGPLGFVARAAEDTLVYRIPAARHSPGARAARRRCASSRARWRRGCGCWPGTDREPPPAPRGRPVGELIRAPALVCPPATSVREAARRMAEARRHLRGRGPRRRLGIVTDRDIRTRVVAAGAGPETPLSDVMTAPAWTVAADRTGTEALLEMLDQGIRHLPVLDAGRRLLGVLDDVDLMANERRAPFRLRA